MSDHADTPDDSGISQSAASEPQAAAVARVVVRYKSTRKLAHETARSGASREATRLHHEANVINEIAMTLLGVQAWHDALENPYQDGRETEKPPQQHRREGSTRPGSPT